MTDKYYIGLVRSGKDGKGLVKYRPRKQIFGKGYLVSNAVLNRRLQAEAIIEQKEDAYVWKLSDSEREIIEGLNKKEL